jgi:hypothetical protein
MAHVSSVECGTKSHAFVAVQVEADFDLIAEKLL